VRAAAVAAGLLALLAIVALASARSRPAASGGTEVLVVADIRDILLSVGVTLYLVAFGILVWAIWRFRSGGGDLPRPSGYISLLIFLMLCGALLWGVRNRTEPVQPDEQVFGPEVEGQPGPAQPPQAAPEPLPPAEFRWDIAAGTAVVIVGVAGGIVVLRRRREAQDLTQLSPYQAAAGELAAVLEGTLDDLRRETDPRRAVIAAYAQLERVLARHGLPRAPSEAPFEYLARMLDVLRVRADAALALTELFERARFSEHVIDAAMKDEAIDALAAVRDDLRAGT
jgi:hypothetical protein